MQELRREPRRSAVRRLTSIRALGFVALGAMVIASVALAAGPPAATTGAASKVTDTTATLEGTVFPNQEATTYYFQYGTTTAYGTQTPSEGPVNGNAGKDVKADLSGLTPNTTYHFRVVATNASGTTNGADATFTTTAPGAQPTPPNAVTINAAPATLTFGSPTNISGQVSGQDNAGVEVTLEENPYPYTGGFKATALKATTTATGAYTLAVTPTVNTHYRVTAKTKPPVTSPETAITVRVKVSLRLSDRTPAVGKRIRFSGTVTPAHDGKVARIQRRTSTGSWKTVARVTLVAATPVNGVARSKFSKRLRINRNGTYRAQVRPADGDHARGNSSRRRVRVH
jgi:hypothetical protein